MRKASQLRRSLALAAPLVTLLLIVPMSAQAAAPRSARTAASRLVPVWAFINGDVPVAGGRVQIIAGGRPVRLLNGRMSTRTNANGVVVLSVRRVPSRFDVVVQGGRAAGRRLPGRLRSLIGSFRNVSVVEVNPLTALITALRGQRPTLGFARADQAVKRYFGVPGWADLGQDLRNGPHWFNASTYVRDVLRYGSVDRLNVAVARSVLRGQSRIQPLPHAAVASPAVASAAATGRPQPRIAASVVDRELRAAGKLVAEVFQNLKGTALEIGKQQFVGGALAALLELAKTGHLNLDKSELDGVREQLDALGAQLTQLGGKIDELKKIVTRSHASLLLHQSDGIIASIKWAQERLAMLAEKPDRANRDTLAKETIDYIGRNLIDAPQQLEQQLSPNVAIGDNAIKATSRALASEQFFDSRSSDEVRAVYDFYAVYQAQLAVVLANYYNAGPYDVDTRKQLLAPIERNVIKLQQESLKPSVPPGAFFDTRTPKFMWAMDPQTITALTLLERNMKTSTTLALGGFRNFQLPSSHDLVNLLAGGSGDRRAWLQAQVNVNLFHQLLWVSDPFRQGFKRNVGCRLQITIFDLMDARMVDWRFHNASGFTGCDLKNAGTKQSLRSQYYGGALYLRYLAPGESYWW